ncbi:hypothetical protein [Synechococcus sp. CBW1107]|uniref:hypothetical protein n=1 Tax=Synechococcus sp. CBW1107 TaxID=2789857 RepID=UPI002AD4EA13|nr:hypothetical protein [Synechococcus sp. CBW1107]
MTSLKKAALLTVPTVGGLLYLNMAFFLSPWLVIALAATVFTGYSQASRLRRS